QSGGTAEVRRLAAIAMGLTPSLCGEEPVVNALASALKSETDGLAKISVARSLWVLGPQGEGRNALLKILAQSAEKSIKDEAALVLAENGGLDVRDVRTRLLDLYNEPTAQGERARLCWRNWEDAGVRTHDSKVAQGENMIREVVRTIKAAYPDESRTAAGKLFEDAAKGMVGGLDPYSQYMDREEVKNTQEMLQQDYGGIGAYVGQRDNSFVIVSPIYGSPADRAGLRANDIIQEVDGLKTNEMMDKGGMNTVIARLKGKPGTAVRLKYYRRSFYKPIEVTIVRESIKVESVLSAMLPADIGYSRLTRFGERGAAEMQAALDRLLKEQHAKAIILDLRNNPGGLLRTGVEIADKFLAGNKLLVYSEGNKEFAPRKDYFATGGPEEEAFPMVVLVGAGSASASEIVAGALQDHKRATLVGEKTFGKGSVQQIMPLRATGRETQLRLTIAKYYLPSGRCIHEKGVDVDVEVKPPERPGWVAEGLEELRRKGLLEDHVRTTWNANKEVYAKLASHDEGKCENWPGFDELYKKAIAGLTGPPLPRNDVRAELRTAVRRYLQDEQKKELVFDLEEDTVLQRGILEALKKLNVDPLAIAEYKALPEKFKKKDEPAQQGAMLPQDEQRQP
ncbi:MAG: S41 family peptidase, partial [Planctomycetota bacterium]|nr:S41 family peptidase [Planctomycetota bacterium]